MNNSANFIFIAAVTTDIDPVTLFEILTLVRMMRDPHYYNQGV